MSPDVEKLAAGDVPTWQALLEALVRAEFEPEPAPRELIAAMFARDSSVQGWLDRARAAAGQCESEVFSTTLSALRAFRPWLLAGLIASVPEHPGVIDARVDQLLNAVPENGAEQARALLADARKAWGPGPKLGSLLTLVHRRVSEEGQHAEALAAAQEAESLLGEERAAFARRLQAASLLCLQRFDEAFALLDAVMTEPGPLFGGGGASVSGGRDLTPLEHALEEAATVVTWASDHDAEWVRALGGIAETSGDASLWHRFEASLQALSPEDLEVVIDQASERELRKVARRAREVAGTV